MNSLCKVTYINVDDHQGKEYIFPMIIFEIKYHSMEIEWIISDIGHTSDLEEWKNIRECILTDKDSKSFGGGGNSYWECCNKGELFEIRYDISGAGGDSDITLSIPNKFMLECVEKIIEILELAKRNVRYLPSELC